MVECHNLEWVKLHLNIAKLTANVAGNESECVVFGGHSV